MANISVCMRMLGVYWKQKVALFVCASGQFGAVVCVEDNVFVYMCLYVWVCGS